MPGPKHKRQEIREAVKAMLLNNTDAGDKVYSNRVTAYWREELPSISIFSTEEEPTPRDMSHKAYNRKLNLNIEIRAEANDNLDDVLDDLANRVETLIGEDLTLQNTVRDTLMTGTSMGIAADATKQVGVLSMDYVVMYIK